MKSRNKLGTIVALSLLSCWLSGGALARHGNSRGDQGGRLDCDQPCRDRGDCGGPCADREDCAGPRRGGWDCGGRGGRRARTARAAPGPAAASSVTDRDPSGRTRWRCCAAWTSPASSGGRRWTCWRSAGARSARHGTGSKGCGKTCAGKPGPETGRGEDKGPLAPPREAVGNAALLASRVAGELKGCSPRAAQEPRRGACGRRGRRRRRPAAALPEQVPLGNPHSRDTTRARGARDRARPAGSFWWIASRRGRGDMMPPGGSRSGGGS